MIFEYVLQELISIFIFSQTKDRVFQAVEESGYRPNLLARNLSAKSTQTLGLVVTKMCIRDSATPVPTA